MIMKMYKVSSCIYIQSFINTSSYAHEEEKKRRSGRKMDTRTQYLHVNVAVTLIVKWKIVAHESFISVPLSPGRILYRTASNKFAYLHKNAKRPALSYIFDASYKTTKRTIVIKNIMTRIKLISFFVADSENLVAHHDLDGTTITETAKRCLTEEIDIVR